MILYFTGTGNCLYAARELAAEGEKVLSIPQELRREDELAYADDTIGVVYPVYGHMMPDMVRTFLERATLDTPYLYFVCAYGNRHANAVELCMEDAREMGLKPSYVTMLLMVDNWLPNFDMDEQRARIPEKKIDEYLVRIRADVAARRRWIEPVTDGDRAAHEQFLGRGMRFEPAALDDFLAIDPEKCVGCGACAGVCPAGCIALESGRAVRDAQAGFGCNACLACMHACPARAVTCAAGDVNPAARFRNEHVTLADLRCANSAYRKGLNGHVTDSAGVCAAAAVGARAL